MVILLIDESKLINISEQRQQWKLQRERLIRCYVNNIYDLVLLLES